MGFYDIVMLVVLFGAMFFGYTKGLAWQIASVAAVVVSYIAAVRFRGQVAQYVQAEPPFNNIAAMLIIFVASSLIIWLVYAYVNKSLKKAELDGFNRQMGALVGAVLGVLLCMVITMFSVSLLGETAHDSIHHSKLGSYVVRGIWMVHAFVPEDLDASLDPHFEKFYQQIGHNPDQALTAAPGTFTGGSQYPTGQTFNSGSQIPGGQAYQGNWSSVAQPTQNNGYQNSGYPTGQTQTGYPPAQSNQGTNYLPQQPQSFPRAPSNVPQQQQQPQSSGLPPIQLKLDAETLLDGAGQLFKNSFSNPNGN